MKQFSFLTKAKHTWSSVELRCNIDGNWTCTNKYMPQELGAFIEIRWETAFGCLAWQKQRLAILWILFKPFVLLVNVWQWSYQMRRRHRHADCVTAMTMRGEATWKTLWQLPLKPWWASMRMRTVKQLSACSMTSTRSGKFAFFGENGFILDLTLYNCFTIVRFPERGDKLQAVLNLRRFLLLGLAAVVAWRCSITIFRLSDPCLSTYPSTAARVQNIRHPNVALPAPLDTPEELMGKVEVGFPWSRQRETCQWEWPVLEVPTRKSSESR